MVTMMLLCLIYRGYVAEGTGANVFFIKDKTIHTPIPDCFLNGITRQTVIEMVTKKGFVSQAKKHDQVFLSPREKECLSWVSKGKTTPEIAIILDLSKETVRLHIKNSMTKLDAVTRTHAVSKAFASGQITYRN